METGLEITEILTHGFKTSTDEIKLRMLTHIIKKKSNDNFDLVICY